MSDIDPAAVMAEHRDDHGSCKVCREDTYSGPDLVDWPCEPYRLADALAASEARVARLWATWEPYDEDDMGQVPWRLQRDMRAALNEH